MPAIGQPGVDDPSSLEDSDSRRRQRNSAKACLTPFKRQ